MLQYVFHLRGVIIRASFTSYKSLEKLLDLLFSIHIVLMENGQKFIYILHHIFSLISGVFIRNISFFSAVTRYLIIFPHLKIDVTFLHSSFIPSSGDH